MIHKIEANYCVYRHIAKGVTFYIGSGTPSRPFSLFGRSDAWHSYAIDGIGIEVEIVSWHPTRDSAFAEEKKQIALINPPANINYNGSHGRVAQKRRCVLGKPTSMVVVLSKRQRDFLEAKAKKKTIPAVIRALIQRAMKEK